NWLILAQWTSLVVYDLNRGVLDSPVRTIDYQQPSDSWLGWGFSTNGAYFFYIFKKDGQVLTHVIDVSSSLTRSLKLTISSAVTRVQATLNDNGKLAVIGYDSGSGVAEYCLVDIFSEEVFVNNKKVLLPFFSLKIFGGFAGFILGGEAIVVPPSVFNFTVGVESESGASPVNIKVLDDEDRPVSGALVCLGSTCATTSCSGDVTFRVSRKVYTLRVTYPHAETVEYSLDVGREPLTTLVRLRRLYRFAVQSSFGGGFKPLACSFILLNGSRVLSNITTANCSSVMMVPKGTYTLRVAADKQVFEQSVQISGDLTLVLRVPEAKNLLSVSTILEGDVSQVVIRVHDSNGGLVARSDVGTLSIELFPGLYTVYVEAPGYYNWSAKVELTGSLHLQPTLKAVVREESETRSSTGWGLSVLLLGVAVLLSVAIAYLLGASGKGFRAWSKLKSLVDAKLKTRRS
ncbi:MAG: hypothetical protein NZ954_08870, partial [Thermofilaceae archaeon]|nr:hypothetical protein [Thermofilaceae archaeon]